MAIDWGFTIRKIVVYGTLLVLYCAGHDHPVCDIPR